MGEIAINAGGPTMVSGWGFWAAWETTPPIVGRDSVMNWSGIDCGMHIGLFMRPMGPLNRFWQTWVFQLKRLIFVDLQFIVRTLENNDTTIKVIGRAMGVLGKRVDRCRISRAMFCKGKYISITFSIDFLAG